MSASMLTIEQALKLAERLESDSARLDTELLLCHVLQRPRSYLLTWPERALDSDQEHQFRALLGRREAGEPVAHLTGLRDFWTLTLEVGPATLIPRPDTETLVEVALELLPSDARRVADLGTGTGAIALALASERPAWQLQATDRVTEAVALARRNRDRLGLHNVEVVQGSWCEPLTGLFDLILSNPPYIDADDPHLNQGDVRFEPHSALVAPEQGLADIRSIAAQARACLTPGGYLAFEHGYQQAEAVQALLAEFGYAEIDTRADLGGQPRVTWGRWPVSTTD